MLCEYCCVLNSQMYDFFNADLSPEEMLPMCTSTGILLSILLGVKERNRV